MKLTINQREDLRQSAKLICSSLNHAATLEAKRTNREIYAVIVSEFRRYVREQIDPKYIAARIDTREAMWNVSLLFWDVSEGSDRGDLIAETEKTELVRGFHGVTALILDYAAQVHPELDVATLRPFAAENLAKRMGGIRPAISRGGGTATTKIQYQVGDKYYNCIVTVTRAGKPLDIVV